MVKPLVPRDGTDLTFEDWVETNPLWPYDFDGTGPARSLSETQHRKVGDLTRAAARRLLHPDERQSHDDT